LSAERRKSGGSPEIDGEIRQLGERYGIPTEFTSYFVREPGMVADAAGNAGGAMPPQTATAQVGRAGARRAAAARARAEQAVPTTGREVPVGAVRVDTVYQSSTDVVYRTRTDTVAQQMPAVMPFEQARMAAEQRSAKSLGDAQLNAVVVTGSGATAPARSVGGRTFSLVNGRWTDTQFKPSLRVTKVKAYSKAYFALIDAAPELREMFALGERVVIAGAGGALEVDEAGREELNGPEVSRLLGDLGLLR
jgi:hypothetical protein